MHYNVFFEKRKKSIVCIVKTDISSIQFHARSACTQVVVRILHRLTFLFVTDAELKLHVCGRSLRRAHRFNNHCLRQIHGPFILQVSFDQSICSREAHRRGG